jgi:hypothetical protein
MAYSWLISIANLDRHIPDHNIAIADHDIPLIDRNISFIDRNFPHPATRNCVC